VKLSTDAAIHAALALGFMVVIAAVLWGIEQLGLPSWPTGAAIGGAMFFAGRETGQAPLKPSKRVNHPEWAWPAISCGIAAGLATAALAIL
jgi:hypothetical protein